MRIVEERLIHSTEEGFLVQEVSERPCGCLEEGCSCKGPKVRDRLLGLKSRKASGCQE